MAGLPRGLRGRLSKSTGPISLPRPAGGTGGFGSPMAPANPGERLILYGTGFGPVQGGTNTGKIAPPQTTLNARLAIAIGNSNTSVAYAGLAPGLVGLYQFNIVLPANL